MDRATTGDLYNLHFALESHVFQEHVKLRHAANHLRRLGWMGAIAVGVPFAFTAIFILLTNGMMIAPWLLIFGGLLLACFMLYFRLAASVARGSLFAIAVALFFCSLYVVLFAGIMLFGRQRSAWAMLADTLLLIFHLNLLKALVLGWTAARRLRRLLRSPDSLIEEIHPSEIAVG